MNPARPHLLPDSPELSSQDRRRIEDDFERFARGGSPADIPAYIAETFGLDVSGRYAGRSVRSPWGVASGQLSIRSEQVAEAVTAGLGFIVLKTVIARSSHGIPAVTSRDESNTQMVPESIVGGSGDSGWTITWTGRSYWESFDSYLALVRETVTLGREHGVTIAPSVKFRLPTPDDSPQRLSEYQETTRRILDAYRAAGVEGPMPLEKDFSPTFAGSDRDRASQKARVLQWLSEVPRLIRQAADDQPVAVGLKLFNTLFENAYQVDLLRAVAEPPDGPDYVVYANRLQDPNRVVHGQRGVSYGGPDLSDRNLLVLDAFRNQDQEHARTIELSATGDISSGRMAMEYALRGATSFQMHTIFQLPATFYAMTSGNRFQQALHRLYFHPREGLIAWMLHLSRRGAGQSLIEMAEWGARTPSRDLHAKLS